MEEITIRTIRWSAPEYVHKDRSVDFFWTIGLIALASCGLALWLHNYLFAIFILIAGSCLILFSIRHPQEMQFTAQTEGLYIGKELYEWNKLQGFSIKKDEPYAKLILLTSKKFLPLYTIPLPPELSTEVKESFTKFIPLMELVESPSMLFMEKLGF